MNFRAQRSVASRLFPAVEPHTQFHLPVGDGHELYVEISGRSDGPAMLVLHGGPGAGSSGFMRRFFDPSRYRIVMFDQRGAGRSCPQGALEANTTWHLIDDIEALRLKLKIDDWQIFGGSWGSTLAMLYAQAHPERVRRLILRGVFTLTEAELAWFYGGGAAKFFPEAWGEFLSPIPETEHHDLIAAYYARLTGVNEAEQLHAARAWVRWESATAALRPATSGYLDGAYARAFARIECHYFKHKGWLDSDRHVLDQMPRIKDIPGVIVQGRYDMICPPATAISLAKAWPAATLKLVDDAGHALSEPGIQAELIRATESEIS